MTEVKPRLRGFAAMTPEQRKEIASKGGLTAHAKGRAHKFTPEEAVAAGKLSRAKRNENSLKPLKEQK